MFNEAVVVIGIVLTLIALVVGISSYQSHQWEQFKEEHDCQIVAKRDGDLNVGYSVNPSNGQLNTIVIASPNKTAWLCNDGVTYWR